MNSSKGEDQQRDAAAGRIISGPNPDRFYCPFPGCNRSFAELWRLKVHYRAPPDIRGSGKERGHGTELKYCPKCGKELKAGKHHVGCTAGKSAPRQAAKRQRQMSTTTETDWQTTTEDTGVEMTNTMSSGGWHDAVRRRVQQGPSGAPDAGVRLPGNLASDASCRIERMQHHMGTGNETGDLVFTSNTMADFGLLLQPGSGEQHDLSPHGKEGQQQQHRPMREAALRGMQTRQQIEADYDADSVMDGSNPSMTTKSQGEDGGDIPSFHQPGPPGTAGSVDFLHMGGGGVAHHGFSGLPQFDEASASEMLRVPSPPPLPDDWDISGPSGMLFDFDQFDLSKRTGPAATVGPVVTITNSMKPSEMSNPSDDYIWQIMFAGEEDGVPKRVTAHLHQPLAHLDEPNTLLDGMPWPDLPETIPEEPQQQQEQHHHQQQQQPQVKVEHIADFLADMPPPQPPADLIGNLSAQEQPQTVTVTYVVEPGPGGKMSYTVQSVAPGAGGTNSREGMHGNGTNTSNNPKPNGDGAAAVNVGAP